jgi:hypothetical protein
MMWVFPCRSKLDQSQEFAALKHLQRFLTRNGVKRCLQSFSGAGKAAGPLSSSDQRASSSDLRTSSLIWLQRDGQSGAFPAIPGWIASPSVATCGTLLIPQGRRWIQTDPPFRTPTQSAACVHAPPIWAIGLRQVLCLSVRHSTHRGC